MAEKKINTEDTLKKVKDSDMEGVSGGVLWLGEDAPDGHEKSCLVTYHSENECGKSPDGYHYWFEDPEYGNNLFCKYCRKFGEKTTHNQTAS